MGTVNRAQGIASNIEAVPDKDGCCYLLNLMATN